MKKVLHRLEKNKIIVLGESLDPENYPKLYEWAKNNPGTLELQLRSIADKWHGGSIAAAMQALESDLEHG